ncbi:hypothetical protein D3C81_2114410 [compost metagenome]
MLPQVAAGGGTPRPRKLSALSESKAQPNMLVANTHNGARQLGVMWRNMVYSSELPITREASMNSSSRNDNTLPRTTRTTEGV